MVSTRTVLTVGPEVASAGDSAAWSEHAANRQAMSSAGMSVLKV